MALKISTYIVGQGVDFRSANLWSHILFFACDTCLMVHPQSLGQHTDTDKYLNVRVSESLVKLSSVKKQIEVI